MCKELTAEQIAEKRHNELLEIEKIETQRKIEVFYSERLCFLWEQYNKLMNLGVIASAGTIIFLVQAILLHKDVREVIAKSSERLNFQWFVASILCAIVAAFLFMTSRFCSQILMERQVYGSRTNAVNYFQKTLAGETVLPIALIAPKHMKIYYKIFPLAYFGILNEIAKWTGSLLILSSWVFTLIYFWPLITTLGKLSL